MPPIILRVGFLTNYTVLVQEKYLYLTWRAEGKKEKKRRGGRVGVLQPGSQKPLLTRIFFSRLVKRIGGKSLYVLCNAKTVVETAR